MSKYDAHARGLNDEELCWIRYHRETINKDLKSVSAPPIIMENQEGMVKATVDEMKRRGFSEDQYKKYCDENWEEHAARDMNMSMKDKCLNWLRHVVLLIPSEFKPAPCTMRNESCGPMCDEWVAATEEQTTRFYHNQDIDTGEDRPVPDWMND